MKVYVYERYDDKSFVKEFDCDADEIEFDEDGLCTQCDDCNDTVNDAYYTGGFCHFYFNCYNIRPTKKEGE